MKSGSRSDTKRRNLPGSHALMATSSGRVIPMTWRNSKPPFGDRGDRGRVGSLANTTAPMWVSRPTAIGPFRSM